jgi:hypothetical protein
VRASRTLGQETYALAAGRIFRANQATSPPWSPYPFRFGACGKKRDRLNAKLSPGPKASKGDKTGTAYEDFHPAPAEGAWIVFLIEALGRK